MGLPSGGSFSKGKLMAEDNANIRDIYTIKGLKETAMKTYIERINPGVDDRIKYLYEALKNTPDQGTCLVTIYVYNTGADEPSYTIEDEATWDGAWDTQAEADAVALGYSLKGFNN